MPSVTQICVPHEHGAAAVMGRLTCRTECFPKGLSLSVSVTILGTGVYSGDPGSCQHSWLQCRGWRQLGFSEIVVSQAQLPGLDSAQKQDSEALGLVIKMREVG